MRRVLVDLTDEMVAAIDAAREGRPRGPFVESVLKKSKTIRAAAEAAGVELPTRPTDGRGKWER